MNTLRFIALDSDTKAVAFDTTDKRALNDYLFNHLCTTMLDDCIDLYAHDNVLNKGDDIADEIELDPYEHLGIDTILCVTALHTHVITNDDLEQYISKHLRSRIVEYVNDGVCHAVSASGEQSAFERSERNRIWSV